MQRKEFRMTEKVPQDSPAGAKVVLTQNEKRRPKNRDAFSDC